MKSPSPDFRRSWNDYLKEHPALLRSTNDCKMVKVLAIANYEKYGTLEIQMAVDEYVTFMGRMLQTGQIKEWK